MKSALLAVAMLFSATTAQAYTGSEILPAGQYNWSQTDVDGPIRIEVNLHTQMMYVYSGDTVIAESSVSTGRTGYETAPGHFSVLGKEVNHFSRKYKANMPWTMWFNTDGEALHAGGDPGRPSSHGCVHLPLAFAAKLYQTVHVGDKVDIVSGDPDFTVTI